MQEMTSKLDVVQLTDAAGVVVAYGSSSAAEAATLAALVWNGAGDTQDTAVELLRASALQRVKEARDRCRDDRVCPGGR